MRKVCEVYLVSSASSDERGVELTFPVSQYEMMDAFEQIHTKSPGDVYWQVDEFYCFDYLAPHLDESMVTVCANWDCHLLLSATSSLSTKSSTY